MPQVSKLIRKADPIVWLVLGSCLQFVLATYLSSKATLIPLAIALLYPFSKSSLIIGKKLSNPRANMDGVVMGRYTAQFPPRDDSPSQKSSAAEVVVFAIGASCNHPDGRAVPEAQNLFAYFSSMWKDLEADPEKWGFLGRTFTMIDPNPGAGISSITLSYWKDLRSLHGFAHSQQHRAGWDWWNATVKHMPFMGIMHEVYAIPKGHWENIYVNYRPFGMGQMKIQADDGPRSLLIPAKGSNLRSMLTRMNRSEDINAA